MTSSYSIEQIRNIALVGHAASGKTTLVESLLFHAGLRASQGSVERGDTVTDYDPLEQRLQHSLHTTLVNLDYLERHINLFDTPGDAELIGRTLSILPAVELMAAVVSTQSGVDPIVRRMVNYARGHHLPIMIIIDKIDAEPDKLPELLDLLQQAFGSACLPINLPAAGASKVVDCFDRSSGESDFLSVAEAHRALLDQVVEVNDVLIERYLESGEVDPKALHNTFEQALRENHLIPICFCSGRSGAGIPELLNIFAQLAPSPREGSPHVFIKGYGEETGQLLARPDASKPVLAHVFKLEHDPFIGKMGIVRVHQGVIKKGMELLIDDGARSFKVGPLFRLHGKEHKEISQAIPGDICALSKIDELHLDAILHGSHEADDLHTESADYPLPMAGVALHAEKQKDEQRLSNVLHKLVAEDPCLSIEHDIASNETVLRGLGDYHLRVALEAMDDRYHVAVTTHTPSVPYRETISQPAEGHYRHKKQTGGAGQFGEVSLSVEPLPRGQGFEFKDQVTGGAIPGSLIPAVQKGVQQVIDSGAIAGFPMQDIRVCVTDGKTHPVDSKEIAFVIAGKRAFLDAVGRAGPQLLEPLVALEVSVPSEQVGRITADLSTRRAQISGTDSDGEGISKITAQLPLATLEGYPERLKSLTGGEGSYSMTLAKYGQAPEEIQSELSAKYRRGAD